MTRCQADNWSNIRSLAFLAAILAVTLATFLPFAAMAASPAGHPVVLCSSEGPQTVQVGARDLDGPGRDLHPAKCAACVMPLLAALPTPPAPQPAVPLRVRPETRPIARDAALRPPARAPPRPPSTAPPHA